MRQRSVRRRSRLAVLGALVMILSFTQSACFGHFALTRSVYRWNSSMSSDRWVRSLVFLVCAIVPVYFGAMLIDVIFGNVVEFWSGKNPLSAVPGTTRYATGPDGEQIALTLREDRSVDVSIRAEGKPEFRFYVVREGDTVAAFDPSGTLLGRVGLTPGGEPMLLEGGTL